MRINLNKIKMGIVRDILQAFKKKEDVKTTFTKIYQKNLWGGKADGKYNSGSGSAESVAFNFVNVANQYIKGQNISSIVDLGCGDFRVGSKLITPQIKKYTGVDVVQELVDYNNEQFSSETIAFKCINIIEDPLPEGDLCIIRQVLQHLSNEQIITILNKIQKFKYVLICDHIPGGDFVPNKDLGHGSDIRLKKNSGLLFDQPPFSQNLRVIDTFVLKDFGDGTSKLLTWVK